MMPVTDAIRQISPTFPKETLLSFLDETEPYVPSGHFLYPADTEGPHAHLPSFFYLKKLLKAGGAARVIAADLCGWVKQNQIRTDFIFAPADPSVQAIVEEMARELQAPAAYLEYRPSGRFGERIEPASILLPGKTGLVFNGVTVTGRCVGERLPGFVEKAGASVSAIAAFAKGTAPGVGEAERRYGDRFYAAIRVDLPMYAPALCPLCEKGIPLTLWNAKQHAEE